MCRASGIATGSNAVTVAPRASSPSMITRLGASRMSSVLGLKASPQSAMRRPERSSPKRRTIFATRTPFCRSLASSTAPTTFSSMPLSWAVRRSAVTSLGKHDPP